MEVGSIRGSLVGSVREYEPDKLETELNALIERRAANREHAGEEPSEESWKQSVEAYHLKRRAALRWEWIRFHEALAESHRRISEANARKAAALADPGEGGS